MLTTVMKTLFYIQRVLVACELPFFQSLQIQNLIPVFVPHVRLFVHLVLLPFCQN